MIPLHSPHCLPLCSCRGCSHRNISELLQPAWSKPKTRQKSPNVLNLIKRFNHVSYWVPTMVMCHEKLKNRSAVISKFMAVAQELRRMNNFNTLMGIVAGLNMSSVSRLKFSKFTINELLVTVCTPRELRLTSCAS